MTTAKELYTKVFTHALSAFITKQSDTVSAKQMADALSMEVVNECGRLGLLEDIQGTTRQYAEPIPSAITPQQAGTGSQGLATFAETQMQGGPLQSVAPVGTPYEPARHYGVAGMMPGVGAGSTPVQPPAVSTAPAAPWFPPHLAHLHQPPVSAAPLGVPQARVALGQGQVASQQAPYDVGGMRVVPPTGNTFVPPAQAGVMNNVVQVPTPQGHSALGTDGVISQPSQRPNTQDMIVAPGNQLVVQQAGGAGTTFVPEQIKR
jgi:hypothetical protein